jgi:hypothetical protein
VGALGVATVVAATAAGTGSAADVAVTNANDSGPGSFRAAIAAANGNASIGRIVFAGVDTVSLASTVGYTGGQALEIVGNGAVLDGSLLTGDADAFATRTVGDLTVRTLTVQEAPGEGIAYQVPAGSTGTKAVTLDRVQILGNGSHGLLVNDQDFPERAGDPEQGTFPDPAGSDASVVVSVTRSTIAGNGHGDRDRDGIRVNEGATGNLAFSLADTRVDGNGGDGVELDERGAGNATFAVSGSRLTGNGPFDPGDLDDGMDVDESLGGDLTGTVTRTVASDNFEQGLDLNENDAGDIDVSLSQLEANGNLEEGIELEEDDDWAGGGNLRLTASQITANGNGLNDGDAGLKAREKGDGDLRSTLSRIEAHGNLNIAGGIQMREGDGGSLFATLQQATTNGNAGDGVQFREANAGNMTASASKLVATGNGAAGLRAQGSGTVAITQVTLSGNAGGDLVLDGVTQTS